MSVDAEAVVADAPVVRDDVLERVRWFAVLRAAHRALDHNYRGLAEESELWILRGIRERLAVLASHFESDGDAGVGSGLVLDELQSLDGALAGYARMLLGIVEQLPLAKLRAVLSTDTHQERAEAASLLELCIESEPHPTRFLRVADYLITLLSGTCREGRWVMEFDPANVTDAVRRRCAGTGELGSSVESLVVGRFQDAVERLARGADESRVVEEMSRYKLEIAPFYFEPSVLRCIVGYNIAARNHMDERLRCSRERDAALDADLDDRLAGVVSGGEMPPGPGEAPPSLLAHESPGVLAVEDAIRRRLGDDDSTRTPAERLAADLDLSWLHDDERDAFLAGSRDETQRMVRMTVVLGHLAMRAEERARDLRALGLHEAQIDAWICSLGDEVQSEIDDRIRGNAYDGAVRLSDTKSRFLAAVLLVARRRLGRRRTTGALSDHVDREAIRLVREFLERERLNDAPAFVDLLGGGWRRTAALWTVGALLAFLALGELLPSDDPRATATLSPGRVRDLSPVLTSAYRDHADEGSVFVGTVGPRWFEMPPDKRRQHAQILQERLRERAVEEILLFDEQRVLQARYASGSWRTSRAW